MKGRRERPFSCRMYLQRWLREHQAHGCCLRCCRAAVLTGIEPPIRCLLPFLPKSDADLDARRESTPPVFYRDPLLVEEHNCVGCCSLPRPCEKNALALSRKRIASESGTHRRQNLRRHYVACLVVLLDQPSGGGHNASCGDGTPTRMACEKFGETPSWCALAAMCAADRSCDKGTEVSSAPRS